jgi:ribosomal protein L24E
MPKCIFCKRDYEFPRGTTVVTHEGEGNVRYFCGKKCRKNFEMGRDSKKVNWVRKEKEGENLNKIIIKKEEKEEEAVEKPAKK